MKIVKIKKSYSSGSKEHYLVLTGDHYSDSTIDDLVEDWCESDPSGQNNGYQSEWQYVNNKEIIRKVLEEEKIILNSKIKNLKDKLKDVEVEIFYLINPI